MTLPTAESQGLGNPVVPPVIPGMAAGGIIQLLGILASNSERRMHLGRLNIPLKPLGYVLRILPMVIAGITSIAGIVLNSPESSTSPISTALSQALQFSAGYLTTSLSIEGFYFVEKRINSGNTTPLD